MPPDWRRRIASRHVAVLRPASLGAKLLLVMTAAGLAGAVAITLLLASVITPSFNTLEARSVDAHVERTRTVLREYASNVESAVRDYGHWDASYAYMAHPTQAFKRETFSPLAMASLDVSGMAYVAPDGRVVIARWIDPRSHLEQPAIRADLVRALARTDLRRVLGDRRSAGFFLRFGSEIAAVAVAGVRRSDGSGSPRGWVLMARRLSSRQLASLLHLDARIIPGSTADVTGKVIDRGRLAMRIAVPIPGPDGSAVASATFIIARDVSVLGRRVLMLAVAGTTVLLLLVLVVLRRAIGLLVLRPLHLVEQHMQMVRQSGSLGPLDEVRRRDEIGSLERSFDSLLRQLKKAREQIEVNSFALGRAESAVAVMHNVRNALNPISTILSLGISQPAPIDRQMLDRAVAELARDDLPPARRRKLAAFVAAAVEASASARSAHLAELRVGREAMAHVLDIIGQQQKQAHERPLLESCDVTELIARNAAIARYGATGGSIGVTFPAMPCHVLADRVILSQVIGNLFSNAAEAIAAFGDGTGTISVAIRAGDVVEVLITDSGEGFGPETGRELFQRGFSTRAHKSGGLGLHWCANSLTAMEGSLRLESAGHGRGATAILSLKPAAALAMAA